MNPFDLVLKGISQAIVSYADGLNIIANQIDSFVKNQSEGTIEHEKKADQPPPAKLKKIDTPLPEPEKKRVQPAGDMKTAKSSSPAPAQETKKSSRPVSEPPTKPTSPSKMGLKEKSKPRAASKSGPKTDTDKVYQIISQSSKGVGVDTISKETGFDRTKIYGIVARLKKQDKIKSPQMGLYKKV